MVLNGYHAYFSRTLYSSLNQSRFYFVSHARKTNHPPNYCSPIHNVIFKIFYPKSAQLFVRSAFEQQKTGLKLQMYMCTRALCTLTFTVSCICVRINSLQCAHRFGERKSTPDPLRKASPVTGSPFLWPILHTKHAAH